MQNLSKVFADLDGTNSVDPSAVRTCHVCLARVSSLRTYCTSCGHPLCKTCTCPIPEGADEAHKAFEDSGGVHLTIRDGDTLTSYNRSVPPSPTKEFANPLEAAEAGTHQLDNTGQEDDAGESSRHQESATRPPPKPIGSRTSSVKDNPFIVADRLSGGGPSISKHVKTSQATRRGTAPSDCISRRSDSEHKDEQCNDPTCRATHPGHRPYRHSVSCSELRSAYSFDETSADNPQQKEHTSHRERDRHDEGEQVQRSRDDDDSVHEERHDRQGREPVGQRDRREYEYYSERPEPRTHDVRRTETHERYHRHPHSHSPDQGPSRHDSHRDRERRAEVEPQTNRPNRPRSRIRSPPDWLRGRPDHPDSISTNSDRLDEFQAKRTYPRGGTTHSREQVTSHRPHRPSGLSHRYWANEETEEEDFRDVRRRLSPAKPRTSHQSHYSQLPRDMRAGIAHRDAENSLRKIRSEARLLLSKISEPEDESRENAARRSTSFKDQRPAGLSVPSSVTSLTRDTSPERPRLSAKEKGKGRVNATTVRPSESQRQSKPYHPVTDKDWERRRGRTSKTEGTPLTSRDKGKAKEVIREQSDVRRSTRASNEQQPAMSRQPTAETGGEHQCGWKNKYDALKAEVDNSRQGQGSGVVETGSDHQCDWKEKYLALKPDVEGGQGQQDDIGLEGLTIVLHLRGKDDLVINTDLRELDQQK